MMWYRTSKSQKVELIFMLVCGFMIIRTGTVRHVKPSVHPSVCQAIRNTTSVKTWWIIKSQITHISRTDNITQIYNLPSTIDIEWHHFQLILKRSCSTNNGYNVVFILFLFYCESQGLATLYFILFSLVILLDNIVLMFCFSSIAADSLADE